MAIYSRNANAVPLNGLQASIAEDVYNNTVAAQTLPADAGDYTNGSLGLKEPHQTTRGMQGYSLPVVFFAGLLIGFVATNTSKKERDVYSELAPATNIAYKMKTTLLKANLLLQGMDTVIENANRDVRIKEVK